MTLTMQRCDWTAYIRSHHPRPVERRRTNWGAVALVAPLCVGLPVLLTAAICREIMRVKTIIRRHDQRFTSHVLPRES